MGPPVPPELLRSICMVTPPRPGGPVGVLLPLARLLWLVVGDEADPPPDPGSCRCMPVVRFWYLKEPCELPLVPYFAASALLLACMGGTPPGAAEEPDTEPEAADSSDTVGDDNGIPKCSAVVNSPECLPEQL